MSDSITPSAYRSGSAGYARRETQPIALVVEDHADSRELFAVVLESLGYLVLEANDGHEALKLATRTDLDLILTDLGLPDSDGLEFVHKLRTLRPDLGDLKIIMSSAYTGDEYVNAAFEAGCNIVLTKPVDVEQLVCIINSLNQTRLSESDFEYSH